MCGIAGILTAPQTAVPDTALDRMTDAVRHRGPDAHGAFADRQAGIHLGHRRLSIIDLSETGAQPMTSHSGRSVIVLNGEIYNFQAIRQELNQSDNVAWRGTSDTEVLLELIERRGIEGALQQIEGMFAFAVWDRERAELTLARDRFGEKPLFIGQAPEGLIFGSELSCLTAYPGFSDAEDSTAISLFLKLSYIPEPRTPFQNVRKLPPGHYAVLKPGDRTFSATCYWDPAERAVEARRHASRQKTSDTEGIERIADRLQTVVKQQMIADVPLGAFLSGGVDSSLIVALMQAHSSRPVKTFTIGFEDEAYNEAPNAKAVADHLSTDHTEVILDWTDALDRVDKIPEIYDEPFADSSQIPTSLVSQVARRSVTVCLSGDAGDEVFGGYNRHAFSAQYERARAFVPDTLRRPAGRVLERLAEPRNAKLRDGLLALTGSAGKVRLAGEKLAKLSSALQSPTDLGLYVDLVRRDEGRLDGDGLFKVLSELEARLSDGGHSLAETMMLLDTLTYLPGDILAKVDRAAMTVSLETRVPFLDHRLFELAWALPIEARIREGTTKSVLRGLLAQHVPSSLFERPKMGFGVPIDSWLRGPLRDWIGDQVSTFCGIYPAYAVAAREALTDHLAGKSHAHHFLWNIAMLVGWRTRNFP